MNNAITISQYPRYLWFLLLSYCMIMVMANWFDPRLVSLFGLTTDAGTLVFPLTFLLSDLLTEVYGYKQARRAIWCGFLFNGLFLLYGQVVVHLPSPSYALLNDEFSRILDMNIRIVIASAISYLISEPLNAFVMATLKVKMHGKKMWLRFITSTVFASGCDSFIFSVLAFYGLLNHRELLSLILTMWLIKVVVEVLGLPISLWLAKKLKEKEKLDIFDGHTNFTLFAWDATYAQDDNGYSS